MTVELACVGPLHLGSIWPRVSDMVDRGFAAGDFLMPENMVELLRDGKIQLWIAVRDESEILAAMTTELVHMRSGLECRMCQCGGEDLALWRHLHPQIEEYARREGCVRVVLGGRAGWQRVLDGYSVKSITLQKVL